MTIKYSLTRAEIFRSFLQSLRTSRKFLAMIVLFSVALGLLPMITGGSFSRPLVLSDLWIGLASASGAFVFIALMTSLRGKTEERTLAISPQGIWTQIGPQQGDIAWGTVLFVAPASDHLLIVRTNGNAFFIPSRAFANPAEQTQFAKQLEEWRLAKIQEPPGRERQP
jgi:hypothetical protein